MVANEQATLDAQKPVADTAVEPAPGNDWLDAATMRSECDALRDAIARVPNAFQDLDRLIGDRTRGISPTTATTLLTSVGVLIGEPPASFLLNLISRSVDDPGLITTAASMLGDDVWPGVRRLIALHGDNVSEAAAVGGEEPRSWRTVTRRVFLDVVTDRWFAELEIFRYDGSTLVLTEAPTTLLGLVDAIVDTLNRIPADVASEVFTPVSVTRLRDSLTKFDALMDEALRTEPAVSLETRS
jgi:hypothetical protein